MGPAASLEHGDIAAEPIHIDRRRGRLGFDQLDDAARLGEGLDRRKPAARGRAGNTAVLTGRDGKLLLDAGISVSRPQIANALARGSVRGGLTARPCKMCGAREDQQLLAQDGPDT